MPNTITRAVAAGALALSASAGATAANATSPAERTEIGFIKVDPEITLRRLVVHNPAAKGVVLFLHGFPETLYAWQGVADQLAGEYEVHAFDWPGYGLSSRPSADRFAYAPRDYARVLRDYIAAAKIDRSRLTIYATDIGGLPALLAALDEPDIARRIIVGDFAPFNRPQYMHERLQRLKEPETADQARASLNQTRDEVLENAFTRGLPAAAQVALSPAFKADMAQGWGNGALTSADAFYHYYSNFTRDEDYLEANVARLRTPIKVVWGEMDVYINSAMGAEFATKAKVEFEVLPGIGHYPHLQDPAQVAGEVRASLR